jgi:hypothetical protein
MTMDELKAKHFWNVQLADKYSHLLREDKTYLTNNHTHLSIQFAIEILEELNQTWVGDSKMIYVDAVQNKVQELKQYLDEKV